MTPTEIRQFCFASNKHGDCTQQVILQEIAAQLAEMNEHLKRITYPVFMKNSLDSNIPCVPGGQAQIFQYEQNR